MKLEFLKNLLSVPTCSGHEELFARYIMGWCNTVGIKCEKDGTGNLFLTKGAPSKEGFYPCCTSHIDTVHDDQAKNVKEEKLLDVIHEHGKLYCKDTGIGADCKTGVACCLQACKNLSSCKCVLYVKEELGCQGCKAADNETFFKDVSWCLGFDSPELNRAAKSCNGTPLFSDKFFDEQIEPICKKHGLTNFKHEPGTDVWLIRKMDITKDENGKALHLETLNIGSGGHNPHRKTEYAMFDEVCKAEATGIDLLKSIPCDRQWVSEIIEAPKHNYWGSWSGGSWGGGSSVPYEPYDWSKYYTQKSSSAWKPKKHRELSQKMSRQSYLPGFDEIPPEEDYIDADYSVVGGDEIDGELAYRDINVPRDKSRKPAFDGEPDITDYKSWLLKRLGYLG